jgi:EAL domain-containing protein (putative c-di-GMP-specific phosphodiesterase class I)
MDIELKQKQLSDTMSGKHLPSERSFTEFNLGAVSKFIGNSKSEARIVAILQIQNLPSILFSYGLKHCKDIEDIIFSRLKEVFKDNIFITKSGRDSYLFCINTNNKDETYEVLSSTLEELKTFKEMAQTSPTYLRFQCGSTSFTKSDELEEAVNQAYMALFECINRDGCTYSIFNESTSVKMLQHENQMRLAAYFQQAMLEKRLRLAFQPIIESKSGRVRHFESLLRILTEDNKIISAGPFIPIAESMGFINQIDSLVLDLVVSELRLNSEVILAMNISNLSIDNPVWIKKAKELLKDPKIATRLIVEITETSMHKELSKVANFVEFMQSLGCMIAIDDFGAGYTSFSQLKMIHADLIKIDGIFIRDIVDNHDSRLFVKTLLEFARGFGIKTVAEFVETGEIAKALIELDIDFMQGNYFSPAVNYRTWAKEDVYKPSS